MAVSTQRGFTLVETVIVIAIIAMMAAIAVPSINNITRAELRSNSSKLAGLIRQTYDDAALTGQTQRLAFNFESKAVKAEATQEVLAFDPETNVLAEASKAKEDLQSFMEVPPDIAALMAPAGEPSADSGLGLSAIGALFGAGALGGSSMSTDGEAFKAGDGAGLTLGDDVQLMDVWIQGMSEPTNKGIAYLYFFPHGFTQDALIHLMEADDDQRVYTVKVSALTGKTTIVDEYVQVPK
jgi:general secretion pathway protein H